MGVQLIYQPAKLVVSERRLYWFTHCGSVITVVLARYGRKSRACLAQFDGNRKKKQKNRFDWIYGAPHFYDFYVISNQFPTYFVGTSFTYVHHQYSFLIKMLSQTILVNCYLVHSLFTIHHKAVYTESL